MGHPLGRRAAERAHSGAEERWKEREGRIRGCYKCFFGWCGWERNEPRGSRAERRKERDEAAGSDLEVEAAARGIQSIVKMQMS